MPGETVDVMAHRVIATGSTWDELPVGRTFRTSSRTITEADHLLFTRWAGFTDALFTDTREPSAMGYAGRVVPAVATLAIAEGLVVQTNVLLDTGIAFLRTDLDVKGPVFVGDTLTVVVEITESRANSGGDRGVVVACHQVVNQDGTVVLVYTPVRLVRGRTG